MRITIGGFVQHDEARVDDSLVFPLLPLNRIRVATQTSLFLIQVDLMVCALEGPKGGDACAAAADYSYFFAIAV